MGKSMEETTRSATGSAGTREDLFRRAQRLCDGAARSSRGVIQFKFELGEVVRAALSMGHQQERVVRDLAGTLSRPDEKPMRAQRLYEAARLHEVFGGDVKRVWELERRVADLSAVPLSYTFLVRQVIPVLFSDSAWIALRWEESEDHKLAYLARRVREIAPLVKSTLNDGGKRNEFLS